MKKFIELFLTLFKIGLFTFGGGYAMIALIENEFVAKKKWLEYGEFADMVAISESTPGPLAVNAATYVGYKIGGIPGSVAATTGVVLPSLIVIYIISLFFNQFLQIEWVSNAFKGIRACVVFLIGCAGFKMLKKLPKTPFNIIIFTATFACAVLFSLFAVSFSSIFYILLSATSGVIVYTISDRIKKTKKPATDTETGTGAAANDKTTADGKTDADEARPNSSAVKSGTADKKSERYTEEGKK